MRWSGESGVRAAVLLCCAVCAAGKPLPWIKVGAAWASTARVRASAGGGAGASALLVLRAGIAV